MEHFRKILLLASLFASPVTFAALAVDDTYITPQDTGIYVHFQSNDIIDFNSFVPPSADDFRLVSGEATLNTIEGLYVVPNTGYVGLIEIDYTITDAEGSDQGRITIDVQANAPSFQAVDDKFHVLQNDGFIPMFVHANDIFDSGNGAVVSAVSSTAYGGSVRILNDVNGDIEYQPPANFTGVDSFVYTLEDQATGDQTTAVAVIYVGIDPDQVLNGHFSGLSEEEEQVVHLLFEACATNPDPEFPCEEINQLSDAETRTLIQQISGRHAKLQAQTMRTLRNEQSGNIRSRLKEIRSGANRVSVNNLNAAIFGSSVPLASALQHELNSALSGGAAGDDFVTPWGFFINGNLTIGESDKGRDRPEYEQNGYNLTTGLDYRLSDKAVAGLALGFSQSDTEFRGNLGEQDSSSYSLSLFGNYYPTDKVYVDGMLMLVKGGLDVDRRINVGSLSQQLASDTDSQQLVLSASAGYEFSVQRWQGALYGRLEYSDLSVDAYSETGGSFALSFAEQKTSSFDGALGGRVSYVFNLSRGVVVPSLDLEYVKRQDEDFTISARFLNAPLSSAFQLQAQEQDTSYLNLGTSLTAVFSGGRSGFFRYETMLLQDNYDVSAYSLGFRMEF